jgi:multicomponent Na+:H+ antiporter subunit D
MNSFIPLFVILPLAAAFLIPILGRFIPGFQKTVTVLVMLFLTGLGLFLLFKGQTHMQVYQIGGWEAVEGIPIGIYLVLDGLSLFVVIIINLLAFLASFYAISYMKRFGSENNFYALFCLMTAGMNGVVLTGDLFNLFVFMEMAVIASYALVAFGIGKQELEASFKYQVLGETASIFILLCIGLIYWNTKTLNIADVARIMNTGESSSALTFIQLALITGFGLKAAMIPFHAWLPDAHSSAPSPISAMLSGVLIKAVGIYVIIRLFFNMFVISYDIALLITTIGALSMIVGVFLAIGQWDLKRLLAYHSISQMGYVVIAVGIGMMIIANQGDRNVAALAIAGGLFHLINHAIFKGLLFLNAGAIEFNTGTRNLQKLGGLAGFMPVTYSTSFSAAMSISGIPPFNGFFSKLIIIIAAIKAGYFILAAFAVVVSIITLASFMKVQKYAFANDEKGKSRWDFKEVPFPMQFSMVFMAVLCLGLSLLIFPGIRNIVLTPAVEVLMETTGYSTAILGY